jgi:hypothetical protein
MSLRGPEHVRRIERATAAIVVLLGELEADLQAAVIPRDELLDVLVSALGSSICTVLVHSLPVHLRPAVVTRASAAMHAALLANLHRAPRAPHSGAGCFPLSLPDQKET